MSINKLNLQDIYRGLVWHKDGIRRTMSCDIRRGRDDYDFAIGVNDSIAPSSNSFNSICDPK